MSYEHDKKMRELGYARKSDMEERSLQLKREAFDAFEIRNHALKFKDNDRFKHQFNRYFVPWPTKLLELGQEFPLISVRVSQEDGSIETTVNSSKLHQNELKELLEPLAAVAVRSIDESYFRMLGGNIMPSREQKLLPDAEATGGKPKRRVYASQKKSAKLKKKKKAAQS